MPENINVVTHNLNSMFTNRQLGIAAGQRDKSAEKLASGYRINRAADDAAGLSISEKMRRQIRGLTQGTHNCQDGISMCQIADGALEEVDNMLHRLTELSVKSANGTNSASDRHAIQKEVNALLAEIDRVSLTSKFNEQKIFCDDPSSLSAITEQTDPVIELTDNQKKQLIQSTVSVSLASNPSNYGTYNVTASSNGGITFGMSTISWEDFVNTDGSGMNPDGSFTAGTYVISDPSASLSFTLTDGLTQKDIINAIDGISFELTHTVVGNAFNSIKASVIKRGTDANSFLADIGDTSLPYYGDSTYTKYKTHSINATSDGIQLDSYSRVSWEDMGVDPDSYNGEDITFFDANAGLQIKFSVKENMNLQNVIDSINVSGDITELINVDNRKDWSTSPMGAAYYNFGGGETIQYGTDLVQSLGYDLYEQRYVPPSGNAFSNISIDDDGRTFLTITMTADPSKTITLEGVSLGSMYDNQARWLSFQDELRPGMNGNSRDRDFARRILQSNFSFTVEFDYSSFGSKEDFISTVKDSALNGVSFYLAGSYNTKHNYNMTLGDANIAYDSISNLKMDTSDIDIKDDDDTEITSEPEKQLAYKHVWIQSGADTGSGFSLSFGYMDTKVLGIEGLDVSTMSGATSSIDKVADALDTVSTIRSKIGAQQNRLEHTIKHQNNTIENTQASESIIRDTNIPNEMVKYANRNIIMQAGQSMLAQAEQSNNGVLSLLS